MRSITRTSLIFLLFLPSILLAQLHGLDTTAISLFEKYHKFWTRSDQLVYALPDSFVIPASEKVSTDSVALKRGTDYDVDYISGKIHFHKSSLEPGSIAVQYRIFPFGLRKSYFHRRPEYATAKEETGSKFKEPRTVTLSGRPQQYGSNLQKRGSIVRGLSVGSNQNLQVDSGLRLQLSGQLTKDVEVVASLTDQNTPIQPEGNTQTLQEIDKVFVQIRSPKVNATLGDYTLNLQGGQFTNYQRKLEGISAESKFEQAAFKVSAAVSRGQFMTNQFLGAEGNQGPYQLTGINGNINILVLAGTERVWIDGEEMTRGENNDYTIEYGNGQIRFTRNRLITQDSRIVVDFQFSDENFQRNYWAARGQTNWFDNKLNLKTTLISESDDKNDPLGLPLSGNALAALEMAGDSLAMIRGDTLVAAGEGRYIKDSTGVFIHVGEGNGNYNVSFSFFGPGKGDYRNIGLGRFEYAGENLGDYRPLIILPRAQKHDVVGFNLEFSPAPFLKLQSELALSDLDQNLYSNSDDGDNRGSAYQFGLQLAPAQLGVGSIDFGRVNVSGKLQRKSGNYRDIDRSTIPEFDRRWNLTGSSMGTKEDILELKTSYKPIEGLSFDGGVGQLSRGTFFEARRLDFGARLNRDRLPQIQYFAEFIDRDDKENRDASEWLRQRGRAEYRFFKLKPIFEFEAEVRKDHVADTLGAGFRFESYTGGLEFSPWKPLTASARYNTRDDKTRRDSVFIGNSVARTQSYSVNLRNWHAFHVDAAFTHRERNFADPVMRDTRADLADIRVRYRPRSSWINTNTYYQISNTQVARQEEVFIQVNEGEGNFRFNEDLNEFEPDPFGDFVRRLFATNQFVPVVELRLRADIRLQLAYLFESSLTKQTSFLKKILAPVSSETFLRIDERTTEKDVSRIYLLDFDAFQQDTTTIFGSIEFRQDFYLWQNSRDTSFRYRYRTRKELNNQFISGGQDRDLTEQQLRGLYQFSERITTQVEYIYKRDNRLFQSFLREDREIRSHALQADFVFRPKRSLELGLKSTISRNKDIAQNPGTRANLITLQPRASYAFNNQGRLRSELEWTNVTVAPKNRLIPFELTEGRRAGTSFRWNLGFEYRLSQNMRASFSYFGRSEPDRPKTQHIAKLEMRAFF